MTDSSDLTYQGSWGTGALAYLGYFQYLVQGLTTNESGQLVLVRFGGQTIFNYYLRGSDGRYLLQRQADGLFVVGTQVTVDGEEMMRYDATASLEDATSFSVWFSGSGAGSPTTFTDDQGYQFSFYIDAYPWDPEMTEYQVLYGRSSIPDGYGNEFFLGYWFAPALDAESLSSFVAERSSNDRQLARTIPWLNVSGAPFDFSGWQFANCSWAQSTIGASNLANCLLRTCEFASTQMAGTNLSGTRLVGGVFDDVDLTALQLEGVTLTHALNGQPTPFSFQGATLEISLLGDDWSYCNLKGATLPDVVPGMQLAGLNALSATLDGQDFHEAIFSHAVFQSASLVDVNLSGANLAHADFSPVEGGRVTNLSTASLGGAILQNANLQNANLIGANLTGANLEEADLTGAQLGGQEQQVGADFSYAYMANTILDQTNLYAADFTFATFYGASASVVGSSTMERADFANAYLSGLNLSDNNLRGAGFPGACLVNCDLSGSDLSPSDDGSDRASLAGASLQGADFTGANLAGANLANAAVAFDNGSITVQHCDGFGNLTPQAPVNFGPTLGLDCNSIKSDTICPNGLSLSDNLQTLGVASCEDLTQEQWQEILTASGAPTDWTAPSCASSE